MKPLGPADICAYAINQDLDAVVAATGGGLTPGDLPEGLRERLTGHHDPVPLTPEVGADINAFLRLDETDDGNGPVLFFH